MSDEHNEIIDFFYKNTKESWWLTGLYLTDGCLSRTGSLILVSKDIDLLNTVSNILPIKPKYYKDNFGISRITIGIGKKNIFLLKDRSVFPAKSNSVFLPQCSSEFFPHLLRGIIDGDGSIYLEYGSKLRLNITSGSKILLTEISKKLSEILCIREQPIRVSKPKTWSTKESYYIKWATKDSKKICSYLYCDSDKLCLERKRSIYFNYINMENYCER